MHAPHRTRLILVLGEEPQLLGSGFSTLLWRDEEALMWIGKKALRDYVWAPLSFSG